MDAVVAGEVDQLDGPQGEREGGTLELFLPSSEGVDTAMVVGVAVDVYEGPAGGSPHRLDAAFLPSLRDVDDGLECGLNQGLLGRRGSCYLSSG